MSWGSNMEKDEEIKEEEILPIEYDTESHMNAEEVYALAVKVREFFVAIGIIV